MTRRILIVEDNEDDQVLMSHIIGRLVNYPYDVAKNGIDAILKAEGQDYDLVLVDMQLPDLQGLEIIENLRRTARYQTTPIIAVTAYDHAILRVNATQAGCNLYLTKPVDIDRLAQAIAALLPEIT